MMRSFLLTFGVLTALPAHGSGEERPVPSAGIDQRLNEQVPLDLVFRDETGREIALRECVAGRPVILVLAYYRCPRLCSLVLNGLVDGLRSLDYEPGNEFTIITVSFDPRETPELAAAKKSAYVEAYGRPAAASGWHFLTGDEPSIQRLTEAVGFRYRYDSERKEYAHASGIMVLTPAGKIARYFYGVDYSPRDLMFGLEDASANRIGSPVANPLRLLCFGYDPATGKYTLMTMRLVRLAGLVTILVLALMLFRNWRRQSRSPSSTLVG
jgi:protein SCO1/2